MKIAVCDDEKNEQERLGLLLSEYGNNHPGLSVSYYASGAALVTDICSGTQFDLIFLDILMPGFSGMEAAKDLRRYDRRAEVVFLTVSPDFALDSYSVRARHYIVKPIIKEILFSLLDEVSDHLERESAEMLVVSTKSGLRRIRVDHLEFCEVFGGTVYYHMASGAVFESTGTLGEVEGRLLNLSTFLKPHRSYIVNIDYVTHVDSRASLLTLESMKHIPISRARCGRIRQCVEAYLEEKGGSRI